MRRSSALRRSCLIHISRMSATVYLPDMVPSLLMSCICLSSLPAQVESFSLSIVTPYHKHMLMECGF